MNNSRQLTSSYSNQSNQHSLLNNSSSQENTGTKVPFCLENPIGEPRTCITQIKSKTKSKTESSYNLSNHNNSSEFNQQTNTTNQPTNSLQEKVEKLLSRRVKNTHPGDIQLLREKIKSAAKENTIDDFTALKLLNQLNVRYNNIANRYLALTLKAAIKEGNNHYYRNHFEKKLSENPSSEQLAFDTAYENFLSLNQTQRQQFLKNNGLSETIISHVDYLLDEIKPRDAREFFKYSSLTKKEIAEWEAGTCTKLLNFSYNFITNNPLLIVSYLLRANVFGYAVAGIVYNLPSANAQTTSVENSNCKGYINPDFSKNENSEISTSQFQTKQHLQQKSEKPILQKNLFSDYKTICPSQGKNLNIKNQSVNENYDLKKNQKKETPKIDWKALENKKIFGFKRYSEHILPALNGIDSEKKKTAISSLLSYFTGLINNQEEGDYKLCFPLFLSLESTVQKDLIDELVSELSYHCYSDKCKQSSYGTDILNFLIENKLLSEDNILTLIDKLSSLDDSKNKSQNIFEKLNLLMNAGLDVITPNKKKEFVSRIFKRIERVNNYGEEGDYKLFFPLWLNLDETLRKDLLDQLIANLSSTCYSDKCKQSSYSTDILHFLIDNQLLSEENKLTIFNSFRFYSNFKHSFEQLKILINSGLDLKTLNKNINDRYYDGKPLYENLLNSITSISVEQQDEILLYLFKNKIIQWDLPFNHYKNIGYFIIQRDFSPKVFEVLLESGYKLKLPFSFIQGQLEGSSEFSVLVRKNNAADYLNVLEKYGYDIASIESTEGCNLLCIQLLDSFDQPIHIQTTIYLQEKGLTVDWSNAEKFIDSIGLDSKQYLLQAKSLNELALVYGKKPSSNDPVENLYHAILLGNEKELEKALENVSDLNFFDEKTGLSPLTLAVISRNPAYIKKMLDKGANSAFKNKNGECAFHHILSMGYDHDAFELFKRLAQGVNMSRAVDPLGNTILHRLAARGTSFNNQIWNFLAENSEIDFNAVNKNGIALIDFLLQSIVNPSTQKDFIQFVKFVKDPLYQLVVDQLENRSLETFRERFDKEKTYIGLVTQNQFWSSDIYYSSRKLKEKNPNIEFRIITADMLTDDILKQFNGLVFQGGPDSFKLASRVGVEDFSLSDMDQSKLTDFEKNYLKGFQIAEKLQIPTFGICAGNQYTILFNGGHLTEVDNYSDDGHSATFLPSSANYFNILTPEEQQNALDNCELPTIKMPIDTAHHFAGNSNLGPKVKLGAISEEGVVQGVYNGFTNLGYQHHQENKVVEGANSGEETRELQTFQNWMMLCELHNQHQQDGIKKNLTLDEMFRPMYKKHNKVLKRLEECTTITKSKTPNPCNLELIYNPVKFNIKGTKINKREICTLDEKNKKEFSWQNI